MRENSKGDDIWGSGVDYRGACLTAACLLILIGGMSLLYIYAFASVVRPDLKGWDRLSEILGKMFGDGAAGMTIPALGFVLLGGGLLVYGTFFWRREP